ncbi:MAG: ATP-binding cassette domain-containing protein, partial [Chloroflexota bacterium]
MKDNAPVLEVRNVSKYFGGLTAVDNVSLSVYPGEVVALLGDNGAGKSTLMNIITGKLEPDSGTVDIGQTIHIGYFNQHSEELIEARNENQRVM